MDETIEARFKRLKMRSWRRGTKEMDMILGPFADQEIERLSEAELAQYERMLAQNDQDLYLWVAGRIAPPEDLEPILEKIAAFAGTR